MAKHPIVLPKEITSDVTLPPKQRNRLLANLRKTFLKYISRRDKYACVLTRQLRNITHAQFFRGYPQLEFDERNWCIMGAKAYDTYLNKDPCTYVDYMFNKYGREIIQNMQKKAKDAAPLTIQQILEYTNHYAQLLLNTDKVEKYGRLR